MRRSLVRLAVVAEAALALWAAFVTYRWLDASRTDFGSFSDLVPFKGAFAVVVAPWLFALAVIPVCWIALAVFERLARGSNSN